MEKKKLCSNRTIEEKERKSEQVELNGVWWGLLRKMVKLSAQDWYVLLEYMQAGCYSKAMRRGTVHIGVGWGWLLYTHVPIASVVTAAAGGPSYPGIEKVWT